MGEFLASSIEHMLPYYLLAFVVGEALLWLREKRGLRVEILAAAGVCVVLTTLSWFVSPSWSAENRPVLLAIVLLLSITAPVGVLVIANQYLIRIRNLAIKHTALSSVVVVTMFLWPLWALSVTCASGLDCL